VTQVTEAKVPGESNGEKAALTRLARRAASERVRDVVEKFGLVAILAGVLVVFSILEPDTFATQGNFTSILQQQSVLACLALGLMIPIAAGEFDLSVGYTLGFTAVEADALVEKSGLNPGLSVFLTIMTGIAIGTFNGILVTRFSVHSLIATLGVGFAINGLTIGVSGSQTLFAGVPSFLPGLTNTTVGGVVSAVWIDLGLAIAIYLLLDHTPYGRRIYAVGGAERVARLAGVRTHLIKTSAFALAGLFAALAGLMQLGESGGANPTFGLNLLLPAFAAIFLGATAIRPGYFNVWGTLIAILLLASGFSGLSLRGVPLWVEPLFDGAVLLVAVLFAREEARSIGRSAGR
jgi:ribose transport system permease protein